MKKTEPFSWRKKEKRGSDGEIASGREARGVVDEESSSVVSDWILIFYMYCVRCDG